jgi:hypothetical protein
MVDGRREKLLTCLEVSRVNLLNLELPRSESALKLIPHGVTLITFTLS